MINDAMLLGNQVASLPRYNRESCDAIWCILLHT